MRLKPVRQLAAHESADVFLAELSRDGEAPRLVVVKRAPAHLADQPDFLDGFAMEMQLAKRLRHPNIVRILATGASEGLPYGVMEYVEGFDLRAVLERLSQRALRLPPGIACVIAAEVAKALDHAHRALGPDGAPLGVVHRDVTPENVMLTPTGKVKVLDFGIAKSRLQQLRTRSGWIKGKLAYMAPEQLAGLAVDARTDLFALGVVLWEMLTGARLWKRESDEATARAVRDESAPPPSTQVEGIVQPLDAVCMGLLAKFPVSRPSSAGEIAGYLTMVAEGYGVADARAAVAGVVAAVSP